MSLAVPKPAKPTATQLKVLLEARGVRISGGSRARHSGEVAAVAHTGAPLVLAERASEALIEDMRLTNKLSQNLHAEMMLRVAAKEGAGAETLEQALKFAAQFRESIGLAPGDVLQSDGSGLSRNNLATPQSIAGVLLYAARQPWGLDFASTLPVAGEDGTMENRMKGTAAAGRVRAKTGTINSAVALSGYATSLRGQRLVFSLFGNNYAGNGRDAASVLDAICVAMVEELGTDAESSGQAPAEPLGEPVVDSQP
jgi:D-alanyl-D-alanine carboxypeptidase/D-alanyl-D-alanine-endopeptidase (penicillin-binding protein 4)